MKTEKRLAFVATIGFALAAIHLLVSMIFCLDAEVYRLIFLGLISISATLLLSAILIAMYKEL